MKNMKSIIVLLTIILVALIAIFMVVYSKSHIANDPEVTQQAEEHQDEVQDNSVDVSEDYQPNDILMRDGSIEGVGEINDNTNSVISVEQLQAIIDNLNIDIKSDDLVYKGYDSDYDHYLYTIKDSDILIAVTEDVEIAGVYNALGTDFGNVYFKNGIPENYEEIYLMVPNDKLYVTEYNNGNKFIYWASTDPSNKIVVDLDEHEH